MRSTLPPLFPVELSKQINRSQLPKFDAKMRELEETPHETQPNHMLGGVPGYKKSKPRFVQPHNCRLYFEFNKESFHFTETAENQGLETKGVGLLFPVEVKAINNGSELKIVFADFQVKVKKKQIEVTNYFEHKRLYEVEEGLTRAGLFAKVADIQEKKLKQSVNFLRMFITKYGGKSDYRVLKDTTEIKFFDDNIIPLTPLGSVWHHPRIKKVYPHAHVVEAKDWEAGANVLVNMALWDFAPAIAQELYLIRRDLQPKQFETVRYACVDVLDLQFLRDRAFWIGLQF